MAYFKIGSNDYSTYCNALKVGWSANYNAQTNAAGNSVVDYINTKRTIEVGIIALNDEVLKALMTDIANLNVTISFLNPATNTVVTANCIIPQKNIEYYTIQANKVMCKAFTLSFIEL